MSKNKIVSLKKTVCLLMAFFALAALLPAQDTSDVRVSVDEVKNTRTTGQFFAGLEVKLKLMSDSLDGATQVKTDEETGRGGLKIGGDGLASVWPHP